MNVIPSDPNDPSRLVHAHRSKASAAFDRWCSMHGRAERGSVVNSDAKFYSAVKKSLELARDERPDRLRIPKTRSGWANWRSGRSENLFSVRFDVCCAILMLTEVDITSNGFLSEESINPTELVKLGNVFLNSLHPSKIENDVVIQSLVFAMSSVKDVYLSDTKTHPKEIDGAKRIGSVRFILREASIFVKSDNVVEPVIHHLSNEDSVLGKCKGATISVDSDEEQIWRVQPTYPAEVLQVRLEELRLCEMSGNGTGSNVRVEVSVASKDIFPDVKLDRSGGFTHTNQETARKKLVEQVLRHRTIHQGIRRRYVLSSAPAVEK